MPVPIVNRPLKYTKSPSVTRATKNRKFKQVAVTAEDLGLQPVSGYMAADGTFYATLDAAKKLVWEQAVSRIASYIWCNFQKQQEVQNPHEDDTETDEYSIGNFDDFLKLFMIEKNWPLIVQLATVLESKMA